MTANGGNTFPPPFLQAPPLSLSWTLEGLFELTRNPSRGLDSPRALYLELQRYKDTIRCAALAHWEEYRLLNFLVVQKTVCTIL